MTTHHQTTSSEQEEAIDLALAERRHQDGRWGGSTVDDTRTEGDWASYIVEYATGNGRGVKHNFAGRMVRVAALALAAVEAELRKGNAPE